MGISMPSTQTDIENILDKFATKQISESPMLKYLQDVIGPYPKEGCVMNASERIERIAFNAHEQQRTYAESIKQEPQKPWLESGERHRRAVIDHVHFVLAHPGATPRFLYEAWHHERQEQMPSRGSLAYDELPVYERVKYHLFKNTVAAFDEV